MESTTATSKRFSKRTGVWRLRGPLADDPTAAVLHAALVGLLLWLAIYTAAFYPFIAAGRFAGVLLSMSMAFVCLMSLAILRRGLLRPAALVCTVGGWLVTSCLIVISGGIQSPVLAIYIAFPVSAVWLLGHRAALASAGVCAVSVLGMSWVGTGGAPSHLMDHLEIWSVFLLAAFIAAVPLTQVFRGLTETLALAREQNEELRRSEEALREREGTYRTLFETAPEAILLADMESARIVDANPAACTLYGYSRDEFLQLGIFHLSDNPGTSLDTFRARAHHVPLRLHRKKDGTVFPVEITTGDFCLQGRDLHVGFMRDITDRRRAEEDLRSLSKFPEENPNPVLRISCDGKVLYANRAGGPLLRLLDRQVGQTLPEPWQELVAAACASQNLQEVEAELEKRIFVFTVAAIPGEDYVNIYASDITERRQAEVALRESEEKFRTLAKVVPVGIFRTDADGRAIYMNETMCRMTGRTLEELLGFGWGEGIHPDDRQRVFEEWDKSVKEKLPFKMESRVVHKDGSLLQTFTEADAIVDANGQNLGYVGAVTDITNFKRAEEALQRSDEELRRANEELEQRVETRTRELEDARQVALSLMQDADFQKQVAEGALKESAERVSSMLMLWQAVENSPAIVMITDTEANIEYVNPMFADVTGYSATEVKGKNPRILNSGSHTPEFYQHLWTTIKAGKTWFGEFCNRKKDGELYWEAASISPVRAADGEIRQFLAIKEDVTKIKRAAEELRLARDAADAASLAKSAFLASMSHEIRTPLNAILGYSQLMLRDNSLGARSRENLKVVNRSGEHLLALINDILEVSKIEAGRVGLDPVEFDLHAMLDDLAAMFRLPAKEKGIGFEVNKSNGLPRYIIADEGKTRQVLVNLLGNAVKFTKQGHVKVSAAMNRAETGQLWLGVEVEDTGVGIAPEEMGRLFQYFEQTQSGRETKSGTGLGLVISRDYARRMGGDISVASEQGKGSIFRFELPIALGTAAPADELPDGRRVTGLAPGQAPLRVLVADDQDTNRGWVRALLESVGFEVREAENGQETLEIWQAWRPPLILMDMRMPLMNGYEATRRIRSIPGSEATVIIALTASTLDERMEAIMNAGVDDLVCKPFKEELLFDKIRTHLGVRYRYEEAEELSKTQPGEILFPTAIPAPGLPAELLARMKEAIVGCDMDGFIQLLPQVAEQYPAVAAGLRTLAEKYDYDALAQIVSESQ